MNSEPAIKRHRSSDKETLDTVRIVVIMLLSFTTAYAVYVITDCTQNAPALDNGADFAMAWSMSCTMSASIILVAGAVVVGVTSGITLAAFKILPALGVIDRK